MVHAAIETSLAVFRCLELRLCIRSRRRCVMAAESFMVTAFTGYTQHEQSTMLGRNFYLLIEGNGPPGLSLQLTPARLVGVLPDRDHTH